MKRQQSNASIQMSILLACMFVGCRTPNWWPTVRFVWCHAPPTVLRVRIFKLARPTTQEQVQGTRLRRHRQLQFQFQFQFHNAMRLLPRLTKMQPPSAQPPLSDWPHINRVRRATPRPRLTLRQSKQKDRSSYPPTCRARKPHRSTCREKMQMASRWMPLSKRKIY